MKKNILIITDSYPPEIRSASQLMKDLAEGLAENGHNVSVATSYPKYNLEGEFKIFPKMSVENKVNILRIKVLPHHKVNFIIRGISQLILPYLFFFAIKKNIKGKIDVVIVHSPPLPLAIAAYKVKRCCGAKYILNLHDIFPQNAVDLGILKTRPLISFFECMEKNAYKNADVLAVPSYEHKNFLVNKRNINENKIKVIYHWIDVNIFKNAQKAGKFRKLYGLEDKFIFLFGGVLGPSQGLDLIVRIAEKLKDNNEIVFLFVGDGTAKEGLVKMAGEKGLKNVIFKPLISAADYPELVKDCNVGIVSLTSKNTTPAVPAKITGYMAAAIPVVAFAHKESEAHLIIKEAKCGYSAVSSDEEKSLEIVEKIYNENKKLKEFGENGFNYLLENMEKKVCVKKFEELF